ncbi:TonB family protein [Bradyrhizobium sp. DN5]|uniref:TonB family protein n=1 Tax=Bradyrhizobium sp. DN5 TaxID=3056950 RepID=UPI0035250A03
MRRKFILALPLIVAIWPGHASSDDSVVCNDEKVASNIRIEVCTNLLDHEKNKESRSRLLARRADAYFDKDDFAHALTDFDEAIANHPGNADAFMRRGFLHWYRLEDDAAFKDFDAALRLDPTPSRLLSRGRRYISLRQFDAGIADMTRAIKLDPRSRDAYADRAWAYSRKKEFDLAISDYDRMLKLDPSDGRSTLARDSVRAAKGASVRSLDEYGRMLFARLQIEKSYPRQAAHDKVEGTTELSFRISRWGLLAASSVKTSSGSAMLDEAALNTLKQAQPFPPLPPGSKPVEAFVISLIYTKSSQR